METWYPKAKQLPITTQEFFATRIVPVVGIVNHVTAGSDSRDWLQHADNNSSVHFLIRMEGGAAVVYQFMSIARGAWANGRYSPPATTPGMPSWVKSLISRKININHATISIEHEKPVPFNNDMHPAMLDATIALQKWIREQVPTIPADREHIIGHFQIDNLQRAFCPGGAGGKGFPFTEIIAALQGTPPQPEPPPANQTAIQQYAAAHTYVGLPLWGAERAMILEDGREYQCLLYERALLHWRAGESVGEARIGWMYGECSGNL
jgi:N-acetyl-anhydromuramyl-L-alanine amidase AmpD